MLMSPCHYDGYLDPTSVENRIWGDGIGTSRCDAGSSRLLSGVHGVTTHENSATMSLYGYGLTQYVVEFSLGIPTSCAGKLRW
jgi:hypothetical protein